jgi:hypothetical protein
VAGVDDDPVEQRFGGDGLGNSGYQSTGDRLLMMITDLPARSVITL